MAGGDLEDLRGLRDAALIAVGSDGLLRISEIAALQVDDVEQTEDGSGRLTVRSSKTDQEGAGEVLYLGESTVRRVTAWADAAGIASGPLFVRVRKNGLIGTEPLSTVSIRRIIRDRCQAAGVQGRVSGHSLRVGGAQSLAAGGASLVEMQQAGRWQSPNMPGHYAKGQLASQGGGRPDSLRPSSIWGRLSTTDWDHGRARQRPVSTLHLIDRYARRYRRGKGRPPASTAAPAASPCRPEAKVILESRSGGPGSRTPGIRSASQSRTAGRPFSATETTTRANQGG